MRIIKSGLTHNVFSFVKVTQKIRNMSIGAQGDGITDFFGKPGYSYTVFMTSITEEEALISTATLHCFAHSSTAS